MSSPVGAAPLPADPLVGTHVSAETADPLSKVSLPHNFELRCDDVQPVRCDIQFRAASPERVLALACEHGAQAHCYTPAWYSPRRLAAMAEIVSRPRCG
jgi:hypothetical protein